MAVEVGDAAPDFELKDQHGTPARLSGLRGQNVVLVFYPLAFSGVCHSEMCAIRDELSDLVSGKAGDEAGDKGDTRVLAVSVDSTFTHRAWSDQEGYEFSLLSDFWPHGAVAKAYGVFDENLGVATRGTFIIDKAGIVRWKVVNAIPEARDTGEYRKVLADLS